MTMGYDAEGIHKANANTHIVLSQEKIEGNYTMGVKASAVIDTDAVIDRLRQVFGVSTDKALAAKLGLGVSAPSNWRQRKSPPFAICVEVAGDQGLSLDWLVFGVGSDHAGERVPGPSQEGTDSNRSAEADRLTRFVDFWGANRPPAEMVWLEQQLKRAVPEYADWLLTDGRTTN